MKKELSEQTQNMINDHRWKYYLLYKAIFTIGVILGLVAPFLLAIGFIPMFILSIAVLVLMMALMNKAQGPTLW